MSIKSLWTLKDAAMDLCIRGCRGKLDSIRSWFTWFVRSSGCLLPWMKARHTSASSSAAPSGPSRSRARIPSSAISSAFFETPP